MTAEELHVMGRRWGAARKLTGLTQVQAAEVLGVTQSTLSQYERGETEPKASVAWHAAKLYGVGMGWLMGFTDDMSV